MSATDVYHDFDAAAALSVLRHDDKTLEQVLADSDRPDLIREIRARGVDVHIVNGLKSLDIDSGTIRADRPEFQDGLVSVVDLGGQALQSYGVFRNELRAIDSRIDDRVTTLNPTSVRKLGRNKHKTGTEILEPLGYYRRNHLYIPGQPITVSDIDFADEVIVKPNTGFASSGVEKGTPTEMVEYLKGRDKRHLIEERLSFAPPLPIKGRDEVEQARIDDANERGLNKEIRMYSFGDHEWYPVGRIAYQHELKMAGDEWVFLDESSVPEEVYHIASQVKSRVDAATESSDTMLAVDVVYVTSKSNPEPHWEVMELNAEQYVVRPSIDKTIGEKFRVLMADQIARNALRGR
jgi:hypothetical protein